MVFASMSSEHLPQGKVQTQGLQAERAYARFTEPTIDWLL